MTSNNQAALKRTRYFPSKKETLVETILNYLCFYFLIFAFQAWYISYDDGHWSQIEHSFFEKISILLKYEVYGKDFNTN